MRDVGGRGQMTELGLVVTVAVRGVGERGQTTELGRVVTVAFVFLP